MTLVHVFFAALAAFRLTTLFNQEELWEPVRRKLPAIPWNCMLCMSVWGGILATAFFLLLPWLNWPLALSWLYLAYMSQRKEAMKEKEVAAQPQAMDEVNFRVETMMQEYRSLLGMAADRASSLAVALGLANQKILAQASEIEALKAEKK